MKVNAPSDQDCETCSYCGRPFPTTKILTLHKGRAHREDLSVEERATVRDARDTEADELRMFQLKALGALILLYFGLLMTYAVFA